MTDDTRDTVARGTDESQISFPVVGIGASAGGLAAFEAFFSGMPADSEPGMAFVLVQHLAPDHESILSELITRYTRMDVYEVEDGMTVRPNSAYIIPPGYDMAFANGALQLTQPAAPRGQRLPIDVLFRSLARDQHERSIGVVLSGTASDGTLGIRAIKGEGGMVMAQLPASTDYDGMPRNALATGLVDYELRPEEMPAALIAYAAHIFDTEHSPEIAQDGEAVSETAVTDQLQEIFAELYAQTGHDFSLYKPNMIIRRIQRRMVICQIPSAEEYVQLLRDKREEVNTLFRDLLIGVTRFFRDPEAFTALEQNIIPRIFDEKDHGSTIRVWTSGCSTGEEAYSVAILLHEAMEHRNLRLTLQVFATDIDPHAIAVARSGIYPASIAADVSPERLQRFFTAEPNRVDRGPDSLRINKSIRDSLIFSEQNMVKDPPFSKMDLITCRNVMIYLGGELQKSLIPMFHYALNPQGYLFLGQSESIGEHTDLFAPVDRKTRLYQRNATPLTASRQRSQRFPPSPGIPQPPTPNPPATAVPPSLQELAEQTLLTYLAPASALVDKQGEIHYLHGRTGQYLEPVTGEVGAYNILKMAREGLRHELSVALHRAVHTGETDHFSGLQVKTNDHFTPVDLSVCPALSQRPHEQSAGEASAPQDSHAAPSSPTTPLFLVVLEARQAGTESTDTSEVTTDASTQDLIASLRQELDAKETYLRAANEELETYNAELRSSVEEMQSMNEEMQSANEELETSKEELQSVNEELATVNAELQTKITDLTQANNDMNNLLAGTGIATIFLDHEFRILRFTPTASELINLIPGDVGRPVTHILSNLEGYTTLAADVQEVLETLIPKAIEVRTTSGAWFTMRILPYRTIENVIEGVVVNFVDISDRKRAEDATKKQLEEKELLLHEIHHRIKNNITSIEALLSTQAQAITQPEALSALQDAIGRVRSMGVLYNTLLRNDDDGSSSVKTYIENLVDSVVAVFPDDKQLSVTKRIAEMSLDSTRLFPLGIIVNELITNIMKYAFRGRDAGEITVSLRCVSTRATLTVQDNGVGCTKDGTTVGDKGFGLTLVEMLTEQLEGTFKIECHHGTICLLEFPC